MPFIQFVDCHGAPVYISDPKTNVVMVRGIAVFNSARQPVRGSLIVLANREVHRVLGDPDQIVEAIEVFGRQPGSSRPAPPDTDYFL